MHWHAGSRGDGYQAHSRSTLWLACARPESAILCSEGLGLRSSSVIRLVIQILHDAIDAILPKIPKVLVDKDKQDVYHQQFQRLQSTRRLNFRRPASITAGSTILTRLG